MTLPSQLFRTRSGFACVLALLLLCLFASTAQANCAQPLLIELQRGAEADAARSAPRAPAADSSGRIAVASADAPYARLHISPCSGHWPAGPQVLQIRGSGLQWLQLDTGTGASPRVRVLNPRPDVSAGHGDVAFAIDALPAGGAALLLDVDASGVLAPPMLIQLLSLHAYRAQDAAWLAYASAMLAVMVAMGLMALVFMVYLRDTTFLWYAGYLLAYVWILALQSGYLAAPLGLEFSAQHAPLSGRVATAAAVGFAVLFLDRFGLLRRYAPSLRLPLFALAAAVAASSLLTILPMPAAQVLGRSLTNPLIILGGPALLLAALWAAWRGSRYALFFAIGWAPLLAATSLGSLQLFGFLADWTWLEHAGLGAGAFEALVLSVGLAHRSVELRRDRDRARRLADLDPLTGLLNRRAFSDRIARLCEIEPGRELCVLFIDVDRFKLLNDERGHDAGDQALEQIAHLLQRELRGPDLLARHGGEELIAALPDFSLQAACETAERLRYRVEQHFAGAGLQQPLTVSIGVAARAAGEPLLEVIRRADAAMYAAKSSGRNQVRSA